MRYNTLKSCAALLCRALRRCNRMCSRTVSGTANMSGHGSTLCSPTVEKILCRSPISERSPVSGLRRIRKQRETGVKRVETAGVCPLARCRGCGEPPSRPDGARSISDSEQLDEDLYSCNNLHDKNLHFVQSISCNKRHDLIIYKVYCCFACQMTKQHN